MTNKKQDERLAEMDDFELLELILHQHNYYKYLEQRMDKDTVRERTSFFRSYEEMINRLKHYNSHKGDFL